MQFLFAFLLFSSCLFVVTTAEIASNSTTEVLGGELNTTVTILLEKDLLVNNVVYLKRFELLGATKVNITIDNRLINPAAFLYYIQVHSYLHELVLSWTENYNGTAHERGSNIGQMFRYQSEKERNNTIFLFNERANQTASIMIVLMIYEANRTSVPGACPNGTESKDNLFTSPSLTSILSEDDLHVTWSAGHGEGAASCNDSIAVPLKYEFRYFYLGKNEYSPQLYFETIQKFLRGDLALDFGNAANTKMDSDHPMRRIFARYAGMGLFYTVVLVSGDPDAVPISYVPGMSYGCPMPVESDQVHCDLIENIVAKVVYVVLMIIGIAVVLLGRQLVFMRAMVYSFMIGGFILYVVYWITPSPEGLKMAVTITVGLILVYKWLMVLGRTDKICRITDYMAAIVLGYTLSCFILYGSADAEFLTSSWNYGLILLVGILLITLWYFSMVAACGIIAINVLLGSLFVVLALLFVFDGNLQYAFVNNWRRIHGADFRYAICFPHLVAVDWIAISLFVVTFWFGMCFQGKCNSCFGNRRRGIETRIHRDPEQRPLIARISSRGGSDDVFLSPHSNSNFLRSLPWQR